MISSMPEQEFPELRFLKDLRPSQRDVAEIVRAKLSRGGRRLHIVAPPGSGKTVLGLYVWSQLVRRRALVLSPNSAIQAQWAAKTALFETRDGRPVTEHISMDPATPAMLTSLTYQAVSLPRRGDATLDAQALNQWREALIEAGQASGREEADLWIEDLRRHSPVYYEERLSAYRKRAREEQSLGGAVAGTLHGSSRALLDRLAAHAVGLIILDECHHLMGHWGRVLADAEALFEAPVVLGLTATPPDHAGRKNVDVERYARFFGPVDYETPTPAVVKDGFLAPYQDLVHMVRPSHDEQVFLSGVDREFRGLVARLCVPAPSAAAPPDDAAAPPARVAPLPEWTLRMLAERRLPIGVMKDWRSFEQRDPEFARAARIFLAWRQTPLPPDVPPIDAAALNEDEIAVFVSLLDRYVRHALRRSPAEVDRELADRVIQQLRIFGVQVTETGAQACASPVSRVLAYSRSKIAALPAILAVERAALGDRIRAVVITDYEKSSATSPEIGRLLDAEAGGAIAAFRALLVDPATDELNPVLVTGSAVLLDDDLAPRLEQAAREWLAERKIDVALTLGQEEGFRVLRGAGRDWAPRVYVEMLTELFQRGLTRCLVGTRGLLGEGWDASRINVMIDLTTVTTSMTVNQVRGRSIRLDPQDPSKLADNWDVVCVAPELTKGLDDYQRFRRKHDSLFGVTEDGAVEKGVGHVHAAFTEMRPEALESALNPLNEEMLTRPGRREEVRGLWRIGQRYQAQPTHALELRAANTGRRGFPPFRGARVEWAADSLLQAISKAVLAALREAKLIQGPGSVHVGERAGGYVRAFLAGAKQEESALFAAALREAVGPLERPRYVIPRYVDSIDETWISRLMPSLMKRYFQKRRRRMEMLHAVPTEFGRSKELAGLYERHWNRHVSPGVAVFTQRGDGVQLLAGAQRRGLGFEGYLHNREIFS